MSPAGRSARTRWEHRPGSLPGRHTSVGRRTPDVSAVRPV